MTAASSDTDPSEAATGLPVGVSSRLRHIPILAGPTASGKTDVALVLARSAGAIIFSVDARQAYRRLNAATGKPAALSDRALHRLLDLWEPSETGSATRFALAFHEELSRAGERRVLATAGSGLYLDAVLGRLDPVPPGDPTLRAELSREWEERGAQAMHAELARVDPVAAARLSPRDAQRILRALEVHRATGRPLSRWQRGDRGPLDLSGGPPVLLIVRERDDLRARIEVRCRAMVAAGLAEEIRTLLEEGLPPAAPGFRTLGYAHWLAVVRGETDPERALEEFVRDTWHYARRQMTWFRNRYGGLRVLHIRPGEPPEETADRVMRLLPPGWGTDEG